MTSLSSTFPTSRLRIIPREILFFPIISQHCLSDSTHCAAKYLGYPCFALQYWTFCRERQQLVALSVDPSSLSPFFTWVCLLHLDNFECTWIYLTNSGPLSMDFLTVPVCTWVHTLGVPDHTWCELSHWQLLALCVDPPNLHAAPQLTGLSPPCHCAHWTSFTVDIVLMTPGVAHWPCNWQQQDLLCKDYDWWWSSQRGHRYRDATILFRRHNTGLTPVFCASVLLMMIVERERKPDYRSPHLTAHLTLHNSTHIVQWKHNANIVRRVKSIVQNTLLKVIWHSTQ